MKLNHRKNNIKNNTSKREVVMKKSLVIMAAMVMVIAMVSGAYAAGPGSPKTTAVPVTATVLNNCSITGGSIAFGSVDALTNASGASATVVQPVIKCTKSAVVAVTDDKGLRTNYTMKDAGTDVLVYSVAYTASLTGSGITTDIGSTLALTGSLAAGALDAIPAGSYSDTLTLTIAY
jgi:spore coat protein U-like protein